MMLYVSQPAQELQFYSRFYRPKGREAHCRAYVQDRDAVETGRCRCIKCSLVLMDRGSVFSAGAVAIISPQEFEV